MLGVLASDSPTSCNKDTTKILPDDDRKDRPENQIKDSEDHFASAFLTLYACGWLR